MNIDVRHLPWPTIASVIALTIGIGATFVRAEGQIATNTEELKDQSESIDEIEAQISSVQRRILEQAGNNKAQLAEIRGDLKLLLRLLEDMQ